MSNADIFIDKYKQLEEAVRITYNLDYHDSISYYLSNHEKYKKYKDEIIYCKEVRNLLSHKKKISGNFSVEPTKEMIEFLDSLINKIKNRKKCLEIQTPLKNLFYQSLNGKVKDTIKIMNERHFSNVPILEKGFLIGILNQNAILDYIASEENSFIDDKLTFNDIKEYISLDNKENNDYLFYSVHKYAEQLEEEFENLKRNGKKIKIVFLTENGKREEKLKGIITPWDIISN